MTKSKRKQTIIYSVLAAVLAVVLLIAAMIGGGFHSVAFAAMSDDKQFDKTYVMDDLDGMTINGKPFDIADYSFDKNRKTNVLLFTEYCYSFYGNRQGNYGLYVYVWNPQGLNIDVNNTQNKIQFSAGDTSHYEKYWLEFLSVCNEMNYENLFYKFKVYLPDNARETILSHLKSNKRFYHVSGIELVTTGNKNATETTVNLEYTFSGFAKGYGSNTSADDTLVCNTEQGEVLTLDVHGTYYRPAGASGGISKTQDTLHSVYFAVPNALIDKYGKMTAVHATWLNAITKLIYVTGNKTVYDAFKPYIGKELSYYEKYDYPYYAESGMLYAFVADFFSDSVAGNYQNTHNYKGDYFYNWGDFGSAQFRAYPERQLKRLDYLFYTGGGTDSADSYTLSSGDIIDYILHYTAKHGGSLINSKYSSDLFDSVDDSFTDINIKADKTFSLTSETINRSWWDKFTGNGGNVVNSVTYDGIKAIQEVKQSDLTGDKTAVCDSLFVDYGDYDNFKTFCDNSATQNKTVYLFRYYVSEYYSAECTEFKMPKRDLMSTSYGKADKLDTNAYIAKTAVQLDFDIIDVTFTNGGVDTVIPVVSSPIDIVPSVTPPLETTRDKIISWFKIVLIAVALIILCIILAPVLPYIIKAVVWVVLLPFKAIGALFKGTKNAVNKGKSSTKKRGK